MLRTVSVRRPALAHSGGPMKPTTRPRAEPAVGTQQVARGRESEPAGAVPGHQPVDGGSGQHPGQRIGRRADPRRELTRRQGPVGQAVGHAQPGDHGRELGRDEALQQLPQLPARAVPEHRAV